MQKINIQFSEPDSYGEIHADTIITLPPPPNKMTDEHKYIMVSINDGQAIKFLIHDYRITGEPTFAGIEKGAAIGGHLVNLELKKNNNYPMVIFIVGHLDNKHTAAQHHWHLWIKLK